MIESFERSVTVPPAVRKICFKAFTERQNLQGKLFFRFWRRAGSAAGPTSMKNSSSQELMSSFVIVFPLSVGNHALLESVTSSKDNA
jgi:hypothetical protein